MIFEQRVALYDSLRAIWRVYAVVVVAAGCFAVFSNIRFLPEVVVGVLWIVLVTSWIALKLFEKKLRAEQNAKR